MTIDDPVMAMFEGKDFPGKRPPINRAAKTTNVPAEAAEAAQRWDARPRIFMVKGVPTETFQVGALARALNRTPGAIRKWERLGTIPRTGLRTPKPRGEQAPGKPTKGRRLYTREQVEFLIKAVATFNLDSSMPNMAGFRAHVAKNWPKH